MSLNATTMQQIKERLQEEKKTQEARLRSLVQQDPFSDTDRLNDNAASDMEATEESNHDRVKAIELTVRTMLVDIDAALDRIDQGTYGTCTSCAKPIDTQRLSIRPVASLCVSCEQKREK